MLIMENEIAWAPSPVESSAFRFAIPLPHDHSMTLTSSSYFQQNRALLKRLLEEASTEDIEEANWMLTDTDYLRRVIPESACITQSHMPRLLIGEIDIPYTGLWNWKCTASNYLKQPQKHEDNKFAREILSELDLITFLRRLL